MVVFVDCELAHFLDVEVGVGSRNDQVKLLIAKHSEPFRLHDFEETFSEESCLFLNLFVALEICVTHNEVHLVLAKLRVKYFVT